MRSTTSLIVVAGLALTAACHGAPPKDTPAPQPTAAEIAMHKHTQDSLDAITQASADSLARVRAAELAERARADSLEQTRLLAEKAARDEAALIAERNTALRTELGTSVHFGVAQSRLSTEDRAVLDRKVEILNANLGVRLEITGATDERGSESYNQALGTRRAAAVRKYLIDKGIDTARLDQKSAGEQSPIDAASTEAAWTLNRRAEFVIVEGDSPLTMN